MDTDPIREPSYRDVEIQTDDKLALSVLLLDELTLEKNTHVLPPELSDRIIDFCHADPSLLSTASLVCRSWTSSCRLHLFDRLILHQDNIEAFVDLLQSPLSTIPSSVSVLQISVRDAPTESHEWIRDLFLPAVTGRLSTQDLIINAAHENPFPKDLPALLKVAFPSVTRLALFPLTGGLEFSMADMIEFVQLFEDNLRTLFLSIPLVLEDDNSKNHLFPRNVENFTLSIPFTGDSQDYVLPWVERHIPRARINQLALYQIGGKHISHPSVAERYMSNHSVTVLTLYHWNLPRTDDFFDLKDFKALRMLALYSPWPCSVDGIYKTLQSIRSDNLVFVVLMCVRYSQVPPLVQAIQIAVEADEEADRASWSAIDALLVSFPRLSLVVTGKATETCLPLFAAKGRLQVADMDDTSFPDLTGGSSKPQDLTAQCRIPDLWNVILSSLP